MPKNLHSFLLAEALMILSRVDLLSLSYLLEFALNTALVFQHSDQEAPEHNCGQSSGWGRKPGGAGKRLRGQ